jgi:hypothetical protein
MNEEIINPQDETTISDEQLEDVSGGVFDNNNCKALLKATVNVLS